MRQSGAPHAHSHCPIVKKSVAPVSRAPHRSTPSAPISSAPKRHRIFSAYYDTPFIIFTGIATALGRQQNGTFTERL
jgi:hypothetical protein